MLKKLVPCFFIVAVLAFALQSCGSKPYACVMVEGNEDSIHVNQPVTLNAYCSSNALEYNWQINSDSVFFTPRITLTFGTTGQQEIYLLVSNRSKSASLVKKITVRP